MERVVEEELFVLSGMLALISKASQEKLQSSHSADVCCSCLLN